METKSKVIEKQTKEGVSLIVLVITIIVMIILAATVIISLTNNGIIGKANEAVDDTNFSQAKAIASTIWADAYLEGKRGEELASIVKNKLAEQGITDDKYSIDITDTGIEIEKLDMGNWEMAFVYNQATATWDPKILATDNIIPQGDIVVKLYNTGDTITPAGFNFSGIDFEFGPGTSYKMVIQGSGNMGELATLDMSTFNAWQADTFAYAMGQSTTCIIPYVTEVVVGEGITNIGDFAFFGATSLTKLVMPDDITTIGFAAFYECESLTNVEIPNVTTLGGGAFAECKSLTSISIPKVTTIDGMTFYSCISLTNVEIPNVTTINGDLAFGDCTALTSINMPNVITIGGEAFHGCEALTSVSMPKATTIGNRAFRDCDALTSINMPEVTTIDEMAFEVCNSLTSVNMPKVTTLGHNTFCGCEALTSINMPNVITIGPGAFYECKALTSVTFGITEGWYVTDMVDDTSVTSVVVTDPSTNATNLKNIYIDYYWHCNQQ